MLRNRLQITPGDERTYWQEVRRRFGRRQLIADEEVSLAGLFNGLLLTVGGLTMVALMFLPGIAHNHRPLLAVLAAGAVVLGVASLTVIDWSRASMVWFHAIALLAAVTVGVAVWATGGAASPSWVYLLFIGLFASYFYAPRFAIAYLVLCCAVQGAPVLYDSQALHDTFLAEWLLGTTVFSVLGAAMIAGKTLMGMHRDRAERLAALHDGLRSIATAVVGGAAADEIYALVARQIASLIGGGAAGILRRVSAQETVVMGSWADHPEGRYVPGTIVPVRPGSDVAQAFEAGGPVRISDHAYDSPVRRLGYSSSIVAPVRVGGLTWGVLAVTAAATDSLTVADEQRLMAFGDLLASAIKSLDDRDKLATQASSDPLTGLANHRTLHANLDAQVTVSAARGENLAVVVLDIDHFKQINDIGGHELGDEALMRVADSLRRLAREGDILSRAGGDEFTWVLPGATRAQALKLVQAARALIEATTSVTYRITVSAGICDTDVTRDANELIRLADGALYWCKAHGRDQVQIYDPAVVSELSANDRAERLERSQALVGLRALARAIDAKDVATREHSERVATLAGHLARHAGWPAERAQMLSEAALVHDVGKIGIDDVVLRKPGHLTEQERAHVNEHAELSARIVEGVLSDEQVQWIRTHHERPDGLGYPRSLRGEAIPDGGYLLSVADAFDVMTVGRPYCRRRTVDEALEECRRQTGQHFSVSAVSALERLARESVDSLDVELGGLLTFSGR